jgi:large subunit ribosomal protein L16
MNKNRKLIFKKRPHLVIPKGLRIQYSAGFCLRVVEYGQMSQSEIEAARKIIRRMIKKKGLLLIRAFAFLPLMKKPAEVRMGKGKGSRLRKNVYPVKPGQIVFELYNVSLVNALGALKAASNKLSVQAKVFALVPSKLRRHNEVV